MALLESILIIVAIIVILIVIYFVFFSKNNKLLMSGIQPSNPGIVISADRLPDNVSSNFTWALWFYINDWNINYGELKPILVQTKHSKPSNIDATSSSGNNGPIKPNNDIAIALDPYENNLYIGLKTFDQASTGSTQQLPSTDYFTQTQFKDSNTYSYETYKVENIDLQTWVCLILSIDGRTFDIYLHGKLVKTYVLPNTYAGSKDPVYLGNNTNTFDGYLAMVRYLPNSVNTQQAYNIYRDGLGSNMISGFFDKYKLKLQFMEYNNPIGSPLII